MSSSTVTYTSTSSDYEEPSDTGSPGVVVYGYEGLPMHPVDPYVEAALQAPEQAPPSPYYVLGLEHPPSPDYVPESEYPEYLVSSNAEAPMKDQPLLDDASPATLSSGYIADFYPEEDLEEDLKEDPSDYHADGEDDDDDESFDDDDDDVEEDEEEEEEHLAPTDSSDVPAIDPVPSVEDTEAFETDESAPTPVPSPRRRTARMSIQPFPHHPYHYHQHLLLAPTYVEGPLGYKAVRIQLRAASPSPPLLLPSTTHRYDLPEVNMSLQKRAHFTAPTGRFEVEESLSAAAARQAGHTLAHTVDYGFIDTMDASICATESRAMTAMRVDDRALLGAQVSILRRERRYFRSMASSYEREAVISRHAWSHSKSRIQAMKAQIRALPRDADVLQRQRIRDKDRLTAHIQHEHDRFRDLVRAVEPRPQDGPEDAGSSC
ncbi:hypothetical protein Tco_1102730 [Tanacetum coccineum]